ncbi:hypothetical protein PHJA_000613000 [Phtheirospermum japonicum]|uniref:PB1 domain-containing protein n=1 Tax=Phtheirospermum japonicum TaxID=374723 RepID=A0A830BRQ8_9LAMI|nr:hypothetical protein PHJA_000613000 [Phtheirospermum japonicum]
MMINKIQGQYLSYVGIFLKKPVFSHVPRPHDKTLYYVGGDTRIVVLDRHTPLSDLHRRLSKNLLQNQPFSLKYQLPNEDLDSLISVTTDEDLENMVEEHDRLNSAAAGSKSIRLRLFLFPKSSSSLERILVETASNKSEDWFFNALNGKSNTPSAAASDRGFSETSSVNCLLGLDDEFVGKAAVVEKGVEPPIEGSKIGGNGNGIGNVNGNHVINQDVHSVPDSPMLENSSSFGSTSSSPSVANLPPIRVRADENPKAVMGIEEQFQQMSVGNVNLPPPLKQEEAGVYMPAAVPASTVVHGTPAVVGGEKVQQIQPQVQPQFQPQQIHQFQQKQTSAFDLPSPDSVSSEGSATHPLSRQRQAMYQEQQFIQIQPTNTRISSNHTDNQNNTNIQMQPQIQESGYILSGQYNQNHHQFFHAGNQYISAGPVPVSSYYPIYQQQQQQQQQQLDQQYPVYFVSNNNNNNRQTQAYGTTGPQFVQVQGSYTQMHQPPNSSNYTYEFADGHNNTNMYYKHLPPQYQTMTSAQGMVVPDASREVPTENVKHG